MKNIQIATIHPINVIQYLINLAIGGANFAGTSTGPYGTIIHLTNDAVQPIVENALAVIGTLTIETDKTQITADNLDTATITVNTGDPALDWLLVEDGIVIGSGTENAVANVVTMEFAIDEPGIYEIWFTRRQGTYNSGKIIVEAT